MVSRFRSLATLFRSAMAVIQMKTIIDKSVTVFFFKPSLLESHQQSLYMRFLEVIFRFLKIRWN